MTSEFYFLKKYSCENSGEYSNGRSAPYVVSSGTSFHSERSTANSDSHEVTGLLKGKISHQTVKFSLINIESLLRHLLVWYSFEASGLHRLDMISVVAQQSRYARLADLVELFWKRDSTKLTRTRHNSTWSESVVFVFEPESVSYSRPVELFCQDAQESGTRKSPRNVRF